MKWSIFAVLAISLLFLGCGDAAPETVANPESVSEGPADSNKKNDAGDNADADQSLVKSLVNNEQLIRQINPVLAVLNEMAGNLKLPSSNFEVFSESLKINAIENVQWSQVADGEIQKAVVSVGADQVDAPQHVWTNLLNKIQFFEQVKFYAIRVESREGLPESFSTKVGFQALGYSKQNRWVAIKSKGKIRWQKNKETWRISEWEFQNLDVSEFDHRLFETVADKCLSREDFLYATDSPHRRMYLNAIAGGSFAYANEREKAYFRYIPSGQHTSVSVVDINDDGWDDFYLTYLWQPNLLFINQGNGTFEEAAAEYGLDVEKYSTAALFADFDNDGDQDLFLGRSLERSLYLENQAGKFVDQSVERFAMPLPYIVSSLSAADFDRDGLLDIYVSTYGFPDGGADLGEWTRQFLEESSKAKLLALMQAEDHNRYLNCAGPPNLLLKNGGEQFNCVHGETLGLFANTLQASWTDYDLDGDPDLYVSNDFAQDYLFRNDLGGGFTDVTFDFGDETMMGFGMGATWGDYDRDGRQDLYVSNMYSKAGLRIVRHFEGLDPRFRRSADGNRLYRNTEKGMQLVSANEGNGFDVNKAGWSWGGQFVYINNDGFLDIYVASGYFSAPKIFDSKKDL